MLLRADALATLIVNVKSLAATAKPCVFSPLLHMTNTLVLVEWNLSLTLTLELKSHRYMTISMTMIIIILFTNGFLKNCLF